MLSLVRRLKECVLGRAFGHKVLPLMTFLACGLNRFPGVASIPVLISGTITAHC
jgi:hypothetical protein